MKWIRKLLNESFAKSAAQFMRFICYFMVFFFAVGLILSFMGRQSFFLHDETGVYEGAIYAESNHNRASRGFTVNTTDDIHVWTNDEGEIDLATHIGLSVMYALQIVPLIFAYWFLSRVFANIHKGQIFTEQNALYLLYYGLLQFVVALFVPFLKLLICNLTNLLSNSRMSISTGHDVMTTLFPSIAFIVAAYIIHYGIHLQDEADHTL